MKDTIDLACDCVYPAQVYHRPKELRVLKSIEVRVGDNVWQPYPTISWLDGVERPKQLVTKSVVVTKEGKPLVVSTQNGKLDETLTREAEKEGVCVEYLDGL
ncbi:hypothetical protein KJ562_02570 [Patescibacteria group bacterium]|nr:hypothetical protein [Patescibacteria group bacterium]